MPEVVEPDLGQAGSSNNPPKVPLGDIMAVKSATV
jgi:hypothetical protein